MSRHTEGPWRVDETVALGAYGVWTDYPTHPGYDGAGYPSQICSLAGPNGTALIDHDGRDRRDANARLISAAPELLDLCKRMLVHVDDIDWCDLKAEAIAAIAKAEGTE